MRKKCKLTIDFGIRYGEELSTVIDLGLIVMNENFEQIPIYGIAQSLVSNSDQVDKILDNLSVLYNKGISSFGTPNISLSDLVLNVPIEGGWPDISEIEYDYNIIYVDKNNSLITRGIEENGKTIKIYKNGLKTFRSMLLTKSLLKKLGPNYLFTEEFSKVYAEVTKMKQHKRLSIIDFVELYMNNPDKFPTEFKLDNDTILNVPEVIKNEIDRINSLTRIKQSGVNLDYSDDIKSIVEQLKKENKINENTSIIEFIIDYISKSSELPETIKKGKKTINIKLTVSNEIDNITSKSLRFNDPFLNKLYALIKLKKGLGYIKLEYIKKILQDVSDKNIDELSIKEIRKLIKSLLNKDKEFPFKLGTDVVNVDETGKLEVIGFLFEDIYPSNIGELLKLNYKKFTEEFKLIESEFGWNIYKRGDRYYISSSILTNETRLYTEPFNTILEAKLKIRESVNNLKLNNAIVIYPTTGSEDLIKLLLNQYGYIPKEGLVIKVMIAEKTPGSSTNHVYDEIRSFKYSNFVSFLNDQLNLISIFGNSTSGLTEDDITEIKKVVKDAYQAREFLLCFNKIRLKMTIPEILEHIKNMRYEYYICVKGKSGLSLLRKINVKDKLWDIEGKNQLVESKLNNSVPKQELIRDVSEALNKKLEGTGFNITLMTQSEILETFENEPELAKVNGFIRGNQIIINTTIADITTPIHEYLHVFLGIAKAIDYDNYRKVVENSLRNWATKRDLKDALEGRLRIIRELYPNMSEYDVQEELFGDLLAEFIYLNNYSAFMSVFSDGSFRATLSDIFELDEKSIKFKNIWKVPFTALSSILDDAKIKTKDKEEWIQKRLKLNREAANWILLNISDGIIEETCL